MKKYLLILITLIGAIFTLNAKQASCSGNDGVSYVTVTTESAPSPGTYFIVKGYGQYKDATCFVSFTKSGSDFVYTLTIDIRDGEGKGYSSSVYNHEVNNLKVEVASFCK